MDRQEFYDPLVVDETHLKRLQDDVEQSMARLVGDHLGEGVAWGLELLEETPTPNLTLRVKAGVAYTAEGRRVAVPADTTVNLAVDLEGHNTVPSTGGLERVVSVFLKPARTEEEPYSDPAASPTTGYLRQREAYELLVVAGAEATAGLAAAPVAPGGAVPVLLGSVVRAVGQTQVFDEDILLADVVRAVRAADLHADSVQRRLEVSPTDPPSLVLVCSGGPVQINGTYIEVAAGITPALVAPSAHPYIALLGITASGFWAVRYGAEDVTPQRPSTLGLLPVAWVGLDPGQTAILDAHIEDARPWLATNTTTIRYARFVATASQTVFALPFGYAPDLGGLFVSVDGVLLDENQYADGSGTTVVLTTPCAGGEVVVIRALDAAQVSDDRSGLLIGGECWAPAVGELWVGDIQALVINGRRLARAATGNSGFATASPATWYYLFAREAAGGTITTELTVTPPDAARIWKQGTTTHRYLVPLRTNASGVNHPFRRLGQEHVWVRSGIAGDTVALASGTATTNTVVSLAAWAPPHARVVRLEVTLEAPCDTGGAGYLSVAGGATERQILVGGIGTGTGNTYSQRELTMEVNSTQQILYRVDAGCTLHICVVSFGD